MRSEQLAGKTHLRSRRNGPPSVAQFDFTLDCHHSEAVPLSQLSQHSFSAPDDFSSSYDVLHWCASLCDESPTARGLWDVAERDGWSVAFGEMPAGGFLTNSDRLTIMLNACGRKPAAFGRSPYLRNDLYCSLIQALRDVWQMRVPGADDLRYVPEDILMLERVRAADSDTVMLLAAWELRGAGKPALWRHIIGSDRNDMAMAFSAAIDSDPASHFDGVALSHMFRQWYADPARIDLVDHQTLETLDMADFEGENGIGLSCAAPSIIEALSELPDGTHYLDSLGWAIRNDPAFCGVGNIINRTHLSHLTYDRQVTMIHNVPFRDGQLARLIFPDPPEGLA